jgi:hypothetical protein
MEIWVKRLWPRSNSARRFEVGTAYTLLLKVVLQDVPFLTCERGMPSPLEEVGRDGSERGSSVQFLEDEIVAGLVTSQLQ